MWRQKRLQQTFLLVVVGKAQVLLTLTMALFSLSVQVSHANVTARQIPKRQSGIINFIFHTSSFPNLACQNVF